MKFKDIKPGDIVYVEEKVSYAYQTLESFFIPKEVIKITATQFTVEGGDRYKKNGCKMDGTFSRAHNKGDNKAFVKDETQQLKEFKIRMKLEFQIIKTIEGFRVKRNSKLSFEELKEIKKMIDYVAIKLKKTYE